METRNCAFCGKKLGFLFTTSTKIGEKFVSTCGTCQFVYKKSVKSVEPLGLYRCPSCMLFLQLEQGQCAYCGNEKENDWFISFNSKDYEEIKAKDAPVRTPARSDRTEKNKSVSSLDELIEAQDRTTYAVRSLAISFVAAPIISLLVIGGIFLAFQSENTGMITFTAVTGAVICFGTLVVALGELGKSKP